MVGTNELAIEALTGNTIDDVAVDLAISIDVFAFAREELILDMDVEGVRLMVFSPEFSTKVLIIDRKPELIGVVSVVSDAIVDIVVRDAGACTEGYLSSIVGKEIQRIVMMVLGNG